MNTISRNYSSFTRLFSFMNLTFPTAVSIEKLLDMGLFLNSNFYNEFNHFRNYDYPTEDYT